MGITGNITEKTPKGLFAKLKSKFTRGKKASEKGQDLHATRAERKRLMMDQGYMRVETLMNRYFQKTDPIVAKYKKESMRLYKNRRTA